MSKTTRHIGSILVGSDSHMKVMTTPDLPEPQYEIGVYIFDHDYEAAIPVLYMSKDAAGRLLNVLADALAPQPAQVES
jgi:hypothetical protein